MRNMMLTESPQVSKGNHGLAILRYIFRLRLSTLRVNKNVKKGKGVLQQARCGPEGSRRFRIPDFMTFST
jgi:hypothetical protein